MLIMEDSFNSEFVRVLLAVLHIHWLHHGNVEQRVHVFSETESISNSSWPFSCWSLPSDIGINFENLFIQVFFFISIRIWIIYAFLHFFRFHICLVVFLILFIKDPVFVYDMLLLLLADVTDSRVVPIEEWKGGE